MDVSQSGSNKAKKHIHSETSTCQDLFSPDVCILLGPVLFDNFYNTCTNQDCTSQRTSRHSIFTITLGQCIFVVMYCIYFAASFTHNVCFDHARRATLEWEWYMDRWEIALVNQWNINRQGQCWTIPQALMANFEIRVSLLGFLILFDKLIDALLFIHVKIVSLAEVNILA